MKQAPAEERILRAEIAHWRWMLQRAFAHGVGIGAAGAQLASAYLRLFAHKEGCRQNTTRAGVSGAGEDGQRIKSPRAPAVETTAHPVRGNL
jgi:hypothetical protein